MTNYHLFISSFRRTQVSKYASLFLVSEKSLLTDRGWDYFDFDKHLGLVRNLGEAGLEGCCRFAALLPALGSFRIGLGEVGTLFEYLASTVLVSARGNLPYMFK